MVKIIQWLSSVMIARNLVMAITTVLIIASLSQSGKLGEQAQQLLGGLYFTKGFAVLCLFLMLNTLLCTMAQGKKSWQLWQKISVTEPSFKIPLKQQGRPDALVVSKIIAGLALPGWRIRKQPEGRMVLRKNYFGLWGSVVFHTGLLLILFGAFYDTLFGFQGSFGLVKGQMFKDTPSYYTDSQKGWLYKEKASQFGVFLHDIREEYLKQGVKSYGEFSLLQDGTVVQRGVVSANKPLTYKGLTFYKETFGYYVQIAFNRPGNTDNSAYNIALGTYMYPDSETYTRNYTFPKEPY
ncbi:MAG: cytochrome c biogenesis protein ResB, partial [Thermincolia bacterium]